MVQRLIRHSDRFWYMTPVEATDRPILGAVVGDTSTLTIDLGGVRAVLKHVGGDHASDSVVVYIPEESILFLGDALYANLYAPSWRMTSTETLRLLNAIDEFDADTYVWSHGEVVNRDTYEKDRDILRNIAEITINFPGNEEEIRSEYERLVKRAADEAERELILFFANGSEGAR